jgi:hypothetical protein
MQRLTAVAARIGMAAAIAAGTGGGLVLAQVPVKGTVAAGIAPPWDKGIQPITPESYYQAIECGKKGGPCVFWDTGLCKNPDFELAMYTPYKMVAYEVWRVVSQKKEAPQPNYQEAQRTRITIGVTPVRGTKNALTDLVLKRGGKPVTPTARSMATGRFTFDFPAFAPTGAVTLDLVGKTQTISCTIDAASLRRMR